MVAATGTGDFSRTCAGCHPKEFAEWFGSQHAGAQRPVDGRDHPAFSHPLVPSGQALVPSFHAGQPGFRGGGEFFPALAVIGIEPLRQYLLPTGRGRLQVAPLSFDPHRGDWFDAQEPPRDTGDWSFWANRGMNWNSQCAFCHMTGLEKNYDIATDSYATTWTAMGISCTQCHGDMTAHLADPDNPAAISPMPDGLVIENCASCHARREELTGAFQPGERFDDHYRLALPDRPGVFYADGQILDEDFEYASFLLSRMGHAGISCMDCHNPHAGTLILPVQNNALCMSCHTPPGTDGAPPIVPAEHTFHAEGTEGSRCVDCHMAETTYMVRDPRRDHGFVIPDPQLTIEAGIPNSCNRCHADQSPEWARAWTDTWYGVETMEGLRSRQRARVILRAQEGSAAFDPELLAMAHSEEIAAWRATLVLLLAPWNRRPEVADALGTWMRDASPLVRSAAVRAASAFENPAPMPPELLRDPVRLVRLDAAWASALRGSPVPDENEIRAYLANQSDQPTGALKQAQLALAGGRNSEAVAWARKSADWDRSSPATREMLAMVLYATGDTTGARQAFEEAVAIGPGDAGPAYSLALLLAEEGDLTGAIAAFEKAVAADEGFGRAWYNLGLAYSQYGDPRKALDALARAEAAMPGSGDPAYAAATIHLRRKQPAEAAAALQRALQEEPGHAPSHSLLRRIRSRD
jgi:predicted CXXCH cytochrome family protein